MNKSKLLNTSSHFFAKHKESLTTMIIALPGVGFDAISEYLTDGLTPYFYRDLFYLGVITLCFLLYKLLLLERKDVFKIPVYTIVIGQMISVLFRIQDPAYDFEVYFLKAEIIFSLMMFGIGTLVHARHIVVFLIFNVIFFFTCNYMVPEFPNVKLIFYFFLVNSSALMVYFSQLVLVQLYKKVKAANTIIQDKNIELNKINRSKDQILKIIGHDLRTPFHQVYSLVDLIDQADDEQEKTEIKLLLKESANKGNEILEDLLKWGNEYKQTSKIDLKKQYVYDIVDCVFEFSHLKKQAKEIKLINQLPKELAINANNTMMETIFRNLISNAIKFSHRGSSIIVKSEILNDTVKISIIDQGVGISKFQLNNLFITNKNNSTIGTENEFGSGYGLNIAKELVEKQYGFFEIKSKENRGTTINMYFTVA